MCDVVGGGGQRLTMMPRLRTAIIAVASADAYAAREALAHRELRPALTTGQEQVLPAMVEASGLGCGAIPQGLLTTAWRRWRWLRTSCAPCWTDRAVPCAAEGYCFAAIFHEGTASNGSVLGWSRCCSRVGVAVGLRGFAEDSKVHAVALSDLACAVLQPAGGLFERGVPCLWVDGWVVELHAGDELGGSFVRWRPRR